MTLRVSVVVPTFRRQLLLRRCLAALLAQTLPGDAYEIIVADNESSAETRRLVTSLDAPAGPAVRYIAAGKGSGPAAARNRGWRAARAPIVAFTDDDCIPTAGWLEHGLAAFERAADAVAGRIVVPLPERPSDYQLNEAGLEHASFATANCFCRRSCLEAVGGFDERFGQAWREDSDLHFALYSRGARIVHQPDAMVVHPVRAAPWGISVLQQSKSRYNALLYKKHPVLYRRYIQPSPPWHYYRIVAALLLGAVAAAAGRHRLALAAAAVWAVLTSRFACRRLAGTAATPTDIAEMWLTSAVVPPLAVFWRLRGAVNFRVWFL